MDGNAFYLISPGFIDKLRDNYGNILQHLTRKRRKNMDADSPRSLLLSSQMLTHPLCIPIRGQNTNIP